ncbi:copper oxidase [Polyangium sp. 6x1]|uniref:multicopper oxidase family protein n=1 Tax=Polyangium sp. 6x1 TaxID=3042689 RepID=UPI002482F46F|nr:copper oxidase [Polyangium sp. 6x1]MDI1449870.1 copper oxidase [Polyangium sp. 6x1]
MDRRKFVQFGVAAGGALLASQAFAQNAKPAAAPSRPSPKRAVFPGGQVAVTTPNGVTLPLREKDGVKIGHLVAMPVKHTFAPGLEGDCWGYNGRTVGPTIEVVEGDHVRFYVTNKLPEPTTVHWHGVILPNGMDGVSGLNQRPIKPGETFVYDFTFRHAGTYMYHPHYDEMTQMALGMMGMIVVHPKRPKGPPVDRDFVLMSHEWKITPGSRRPDPNEMTDFNVLTFNSKAFPGTEPLVVGRGERVRIRFGNLSAMDHHPIHFHGLTFETTWTDGGEIPAAARHPETTVLVPVGSTRVIEFVPDELGDWAFHCHMTHHVMNQMGHGMPVMVGADARKIDPRMQSLVPSYMTMGQTGMGDMAEMGMPVPKNSIPMGGGPGPFGSIDMGGMFTILKVRDDPETADPKGWYQHPNGTVADRADASRMKADGIDPDATFG